MKNAPRIRKNEQLKNDALSQNFMKLRLLVALENVNTQTHPQDTCFISIDKLSSKPQTYILTFYYKCVSHLPDIHPDTHS